MGKDMQWFLGMAIPAFLTYAGLLWAVYTWLVKKIESGDNALHARISGLKNDHVTHTEFARFIEQQERWMDRQASESERALNAVSEEMRTTRRDLTGRLDNILHIVSRPQPLSHPTAKSQE